MEPVTHVLTGTCLARTGLNRRTAYATATMAIAAEFPDIDTIWSLRGPVEGFTHHRGITHTFLGLPFEAALVLVLIYAWHRWRSSRRKDNLTMAVPPNWALLYVSACIALLSHLLLDYTNNYGIRPFFPFNDHWYAGSIVFIVDPAILALLCIGLAAPALFGLISSEVGVRRPAFRGRGWAIAVLVAISVLWTLRATQHNRAINLAMEQSISAPASPATETTEDNEQIPQSAPTFLTPQRSLAAPNPFSPFRWSVATDFGPGYQLAEVDTLNGTLVPAQALIPKPSRDAAVLFAARSPLGRAFIDWSFMPVVTLTKPQSQLGSSSGADANAAETLSTVKFEDARFMGGWMRESGRSALTAIIHVDPAGRIVHQAMDGRTEH